MRGRTLILLATLALAPVLAGCVTQEPIHVAYRVASGQTKTLAEDTLVEGSLLVEPNATLVLTSAHVTIQQALIVEGSLVATDSRLVFEGPYDRHEARLDGPTTFEASTLEGLDSIRVDAPTTFQGGAVSTHCLVARATLASDATAWTFPRGACDAYGGWDSGTSAPNGALVVHDARASFEKGALTFLQAPAVRVDSGALALGNLTMDASNAGGSALLTQRAGRVDAWGVTFRAANFANGFRIDGGTTRLVDAPLPRNTAPPSVGAQGRLEVAWTVRVLAVKLPDLDASPDASGPRLRPAAQAPVPGANVTMTGASDPSTVEDRAVTDAKGEARLVALEYVYAGGTESRAGNPHALRADAAGLQGASAAMVFEAPASATVPMGPKVVAPAALALARG